MWQTSGNSSAILTTMFWWIFTAAWLSHASSVNVSISQDSGQENPACFLSNGSLPCKTISYALEILDDPAFDEETTFVFSILDEVFYLQTQVKISQPRKDRDIFITTADKSRRTVIRARSESAGIVMGNEQAELFISTYNLHVSNIEFQEFSTNSAAVVIIWRSDSVSFTNCVFRNNKRSGINAFDSGVKIEGCLFLNNSANSKYWPVIPGLSSVAGGAGFVFLVLNSLDVVVRNTTFSGNSAGFNDSENFIAPRSHSVVPRMNLLGGGLLVAFLDKAKWNTALVEDSVFEKNKATFGGGLFHCSCRFSEGNLMKVKRSIFDANLAAQGGGGLGTSVWDFGTADTLIEDCVIRDNWSRRGGGMDVFIMNYYSLIVRQSGIKFVNLTLDGNKGRSSAAVRLDSALPFSFPVYVKPEFIDCTIKNHGANYLTYTAPFTSHRVDVKFAGRNVFTTNHGAGALEYEAGVIHVNGTLEFIGNSGSQGGAVFLRSSQITLYPGSELRFEKNVASGEGGAILVLTRVMYEFIREYNPDCVVVYIEGRTPPSQWKAKVSFIGNSAKVKGAAVYISSLSACLWNEEYPFYSVEKALRWNNTFVYSGNFLHPSKNFKPLSGPDYDIATDTHHFKDEDNDDKSIKLSPGETVNLDIEGYDELNHSIFTIATFMERGASDSSHHLHLDNAMRLLSPVDKVARVPFSYRVVNKTLYNKLTKQTVHRFQLEDVFSTLKNRYLFNVTAIPCRPGFKFEETKCVCDKQIEGVLWCSDDGRTVYLQKGYWGGAVDGRLVTYFCPSHYCRCVHNGNLPGCMFNPDRIDEQCAHNRTGVLCGRCDKGLSVGLRWEDCLNCEGRGIWVIAVVVLIVVILCIIVIILNPSISSELRGPLFFFQVLPFIFEPNNVVGESVVFVADLLNFGGPFSYLIHSCIIEGMTNLYAVAIGYLIPFVTLTVFLVSYILSANCYVVKFKFRKNSSLQSFWLMTLFTYNYLAVTTFMLLHCPRVGGNFVFFYDGNVPCFQDRHLGITVLAVFVFLVLVLPFPISVLLLTRGYWRVDPQYVSTLTNGLRPSCSWWWSVDLLRRVLLMATYAFFPNWHTKQVVMIVMCSMILAVHSVFQPYIKKRVNVMETLYLYILCIMAIMQVLQQINIANVVCLMFLITTTVHAFALTVYKAVVFFQKRCKRTCPTRYTSRKDYGSMNETDVEESLDVERKERKNIFDIIFSKSDDIEDSLDS